MADEAKKKAKAAEKAAKKQERSAKREKRNQTWKQVWQAFNMLRKKDKKLVPYMLIIWIGIALLMFAIGSLWGGHWWMLVLGIVLGFAVAMWFFSKRLENNMYDQVDNSPGAAGWALENMRNTMGIAWVVENGVAGTTQMDIVHRVVGNPGVIFVGEGNPNRLKPLMNQQVKRADRLLAGVPIYQVIVGDDTEAGQVPLKKLQRHMLKFPRNYKKGEVMGVAAKVEALDHVRGGQQAGLPKGPVPKQAQNMAGMNRRMRRASERSKKK